MGKDYYSEQWDSAPMEMDPSLKAELLDKIKLQAGITGNKSAGRRLMLYRLMRVAAVLLFLLASGSAFYFYQKSQGVMADTIVSVEKGQKASITLPDGTKVWVNSGSELKYGSRFNSNERRLSLEGEAYFEVAKDKKRPFVVETGNISVKALGTSFNIKSYANEDHISTVLMTGKVEVVSGDEKVLLSPNEQVVFDKRSMSLNKNKVFDARDYSGWKDNMLRFDAETFENIAKTLERHYNTRIVFESESLKKHRFTGTPGNTSLGSILQVLSLTSPLSYEISDSVIIFRENTRQKRHYERAIK